MGIDRGNMGIDRTCEQCWNSASLSLTQHVYVLGVGWLYTFYNCLLVSQHMELMHRNEAGGDDDIPGGVPKYEHIRKELTRWALAHPIHMILSQGIPTEKAVSCIGLSSASRVIAYPSGFPSLLLGVEWVGMVQYISHASACARSKTYNLPPLACRHLTAWHAS